jgi:hypothetical protein
MLVAPTRASWGAWIDIVVFATARSPVTRGVTVMSAARRVGFGARSGPVGLDVATARLAHPAESCSGDGVWIQQRDDGVRVVVIDVLGHGLEAGRVANTMVDVIAESPECEAESLMRRLHGVPEVVQRGAAVGVFDIASDGRGSFLGVGNIGARPLGSGPWLDGRPGTVGLSVPSVRRQPFTMPPGSSYVIYSDGLAVGFDMPAAVDASSASCALAAVLANAERRTDDATWVVVRRTS